MCKKLIGLALIGLVGAYVFSETRVGSHVRAFGARVGTNFEKSVTPEMELGRIKNEVGQLGGDIDKVKGDLAEANVNVRLLRQEIEDVRKDVKDSETAVRKHGEVVKAASQNDQIQWGFRTVSYSNAKEMLLGDVKRHNDLKARLKTREQALTIQEQTRDLVEQQLQEMLKQKDELNSAVAEMEAEIKLASVEQIRSKYQNDGTRMSEIKSSLSELRKRIMVQREKLHVSDTYTRSPAADKSVDDILQGLDNVPKPAPTDEVKIVTKK